MTDAEQLLWKHLRAHRLSGQKFRRQQPIGPYIVDFVHFKARLIIECDGGQHNGSKPDRRRDAWLEDQGFKVLRFWNHDILNRTEAVLSRLYEVLSPLSPNPSPARGEGDGGTTTGQGNALSPPSPLAEEGDGGMTTGQGNALSPPSPLAGEGPGERGKQAKNINHE